MYFMFNNIMNFYKDFKIVDVYKFINKEFLKNFSNLKTTL